MDIWYYIDAFAVRPTLLISGILLSYWLYKIVRTRSAFFLYVLAIMAAVTDLVAQLHDLEVLVGTADHRNRLYYTWGIIGVASIPGWINVYRTISDRLLAKPAACGNDKGDLLS